MGRAVIEQFATNAEAAVSGRLCPDCDGEGTVGVAYQGRWLSTDPRDWDTEDCPRCGGSGRIR